MLDDALDLNDGATLTTDVCIIGAGAAGITLALELAKSRMDVLVLESGGLQPEDATQRLYEGSVVDERLHSPPDRYRQRRFGGSTTIWGGRCAPLDPIDFEAREYIPHSGWPIDLETLRPYYARASQICELGPFQFRAGEAFSRPLPPMIPGFKSDHFTSDSLERFSCPTNFGVRYGTALRKSRNVRILLHANLAKILFQPGAAVVDSLIVRTLAGKSFTVRPRQVILATGGLEIPRLLLANTDRWAQGIGNQHDAVGRYYMCHVAGTIGILRPKVPGASIWHGYDVADNGVYCRRRLALSAATQRQLRVGNFIARLHHQSITDPAHRSAVLSALQLAKGLISYEYGKRLHGEEHDNFGTWMAHARNVLSAPWEVMAFGHHMLRDRFLAARKFPSIIVRSPKGHYSLDFHAEQIPSPISRMTLTSERDALGLQKLLIDWRYADADIATVREAIGLFATELQRSGAGTFEYDPASIELEMARYGAYGGHHLGTARMGSDPKSSVVDANGRVHETENLYVAGGAVFPTSSQANPTLTIVALAVRLADHLRQKAEIPASGDAYSNRALS